MKTLFKTLMVTTALALAYPAVAAGPASAPRAQDVTHEQHMKFAADRFDAIDANKDGKISAEERAAMRRGRGMAAPAEMTREQHMQFAEERFKAMDVNQDGKITADERRAHRGGKAGMYRKNCAASAPEGCYGQGPRGRFGPGASVPVAK